MNNALPKSDFGQKSRYTSESNAILILARNNLGEMERLLYNILAVCVATSDAIPLREFYPYDLSVNQQLIANDDASSRNITLDPPLVFFGQNYTSCKVCFVAMYNMVGYASDHRGQLVNYNSVKPRIFEY